MDYRNQLEGNTEAGVDPSVEPSFHLYKDLVSIPRTEKREMKQKRQTKSKQSSQQPSYQMIVKTNHVAY